MGLFDFFKVKAPDKGKARPGAAKPGAKPGAKKAKAPVVSKGTVSFDGHSFPIIEWNAKGFIITDYDMDLLVEGQRLKCEVHAWDDKQTVKGKADALVTKITDDNKLAAAFQMTFFTATKR
jgi:hypothetical protein